LFLLVLELKLAGVPTREKSDRMVIEAIPLAPIAGSVIKVIGNY
jgi:hypothetical protein